MKKIIALTILLSLLCGCANQSNTEPVPLNKTVQCSKPYIINQGSCCLDLNDNGICDYIENPTTTLPVSKVTTSTSPNPTHNITDYCVDGVKDNNEAGVDCGGACKPCKTVCDDFINDSLSKPAARTTKLCLSTSSVTDYMNSSLSIKKENGSIMLVAFDENKGSTKIGLAKGKDVVFGNTSVRFTGYVESGSVTYAEVYVWAVGKIECTTPSDCGEHKALGLSCLNGREIVNQFVSYICVNPGTPKSRCQASQTSELVVECQNGYACVNGDNKCFPSKCINGIWDGYEDALDCGGGECRPCQCFNGQRDAGEEGIDCGGECRRCRANETGTGLPAPLVTISSPKSALYVSDKVDLLFIVSNEANCSYVLNTGPKIFIGKRRNITLQVISGQNTINVFCTDSSGRNATAKQVFAASPLKTEACDLNNVSALYDKHFDKVFFYTDDESLLGSTDHCGVDTFDYALTYLNDMSPHVSVRNDSAKMGDGLLNGTRMSRISYECRETGRLSINYAILESSMKPAGTGVMMIIYFNETMEVSRAGSFWRVYSYKNGTDAVDVDNYIDVKYQPTLSACGKGSGMKYQEIDLSALASTMDTQDIKIRIGLYTNMISSEISLSEVELAG